MPAAYIPILFFLAFAILVPVAWLAVIRWKPKLPDAPSSTSTESPVVAEEIMVVAETNDTSVVAEVTPITAAVPQSSESLDEAAISRFFLIAALFVVFSVAIVLVLPWALRFRSWIEDGHGSSAFFALLVFFAILLVAYTWLRKQHLFDDQPSIPRSTLLRKTTP